MPQSRNRIFEMTEVLRAQSTSILYTTHYMEEAERLCNRIAAIDHGSIISEGTHEELVRNAFGSSSQVVARFAGAKSAIAGWVEKRGGRIADGAAQFTVQHPSEIAGLLDDASAHKLSRKTFRCGSRTSSRFFSTHRKGVARLIFAIARTALTALRRDRASLALSFVFPIAFFTIFAMVFSGQHNTIARVHVIVVDEYHGAASRDLVRGLEREGSLLDEADSGSLSSCFSGAGPCFTSTSSRTFQASS